MKYYIGTDLGGTNIAGGLVDENGKIIDALKRVDAEMSSERLVLPGLLYRLPPPQDKLSMLTCTVEEIMARIDALPRDMELSKALMSVLQGISPIMRCM